MVLRIIPTAVYNLGSQECGGTIVPWDHFSVILSESFVFVETAVFATFR